MGCSRVDECFKYRWRRSRVLFLRQSNLPCRGCTVASPAIDPGYVALKGDGKGQLQPDAGADSSQPREAILPSGARRGALASQAAQCSPAVPFPLNSLWGTGTARSLGFSRDNRLRSYEHIGSSRSAKSPARAAAVAESGPFSNVSVDLHGVKTPGDTAHELDQNLRRRVFCGKLLAIARC
jgi:hypothetical protein